MLDASRLRDIWRELGPRGQLTLVISGLLVLGTIFLLYRFSARPSYATVVSGLDPAAATKATKALEGAGISYRLGDGGSAISVKEGDVAKARLALARNGGLPGNHVGFELFDKKSLGATDFQQKVDYQRALEGEIARTIEQIDSVQSAEVQLVLPEESLFADEASKASAAVLLTASGLDSGTIRGIAQLVASSVKGLTPDNVTITDSRGILLWPNGEAGGELTAAAKVEAEQLYANQLSGQINALLASTLGPGKAQARVHANLTLDRTEIAKVTYADKGVPLQSQTETETLGSKGSALPVPAGVSGNVPTYQGLSGGSGQSTYDRRTDTTTYGVDKTVERTTLAPGAVKRLDVALLVDKSVPDADVASLKAAVASMAGLDRKRGDTLAVSRVDFAPPPPPAAKAGPLAVVGRFLASAKVVGLSLAALVFLVLMARGLRRREREGVAPEPTWLREIEASWPLRELEAPTARIEIDPDSQRRAALRGELEELARSQPEQVAQQVTQWIQD